MDGRDVGCCTLLRGTRFDVLGRLYVDGLAVGVYAGRVDGLGDGRVVGRVDGRAVGVVAGLVDGRVDGRVVVRFVGGLEPAGGRYDGGR